MTQAALLEHIEHPFGKGALTANGIQYSALHTTTTDVYEAIPDLATISLPSLAQVVEIEFALTLSEQSSSTTEAVLYKWQASDDNSNWEDLCAEQTHSADASALAESTQSGRFAPTGNFLGRGGTVYVRAAIKSGSAGGETAKGKTKNSSYVKIKYRLGS